MPKTETEIENEWNLRKALVLKEHVIDARQVLAKAKAKTDFIVENRIPRGAISMLAGPPGSSKSWLAYDLILSALAGEPSWLGEVMNIKRREEALILNFDNPTNELGRRMRRLGLGYDESRIKFHSPDRNALKLPGSAEDLLAMVDAIKPTIVLCDSLRQSHTSDENDSGEMAEIMGHFKTWVQDSGASVILIHHTNKDTLATGTGSVRGSVEIPASCDAIVEIGRAEKGISEARWTKHRGWMLSEQDESRRFRLIDEGDETFLEYVEPRTKRNG
jgi:RecA-family ATPase